MWPVQRRQMWVITKAYRNNKILFDQKKMGGGAEHTWVGMDEMIAELIGRDYGGRRRMNKMRRDKCSRPTSNFDLLEKSNYVE